jgi:tetratricopeptide (TPR) repeat protein
VVIGEEVLRRLDRADSWSWNYYEIDSLRGSAYFLTGNPEKAIRSYQAAAAHIPSPELLTNLATAYLAAEEFDRAEHTIRLALAYDSGNPKARSASQFLKRRRDE